MGSREELERGCQENEVLFVASGELAPFKNDKEHLGLTMVGEIKSVPSVEEAFTSLNELLQNGRPPGLIIVGLNNPGEITGIEFAMRIRNHEGTSNTSIIILTAFAKSLSGKFLSEIQELDVQLIERNLL